MYAVIQTGGKQYKVSQGDVVYIEKLDAEDGADYTFEQVVAISGDDGLKGRHPLCRGRQRHRQNCQVRQGQKNHGIHLPPPKRTPSARWATGSPTPR